jgi:hypothetical protein
MPKTTDTTQIVRHLKEHFIQWLNQRLPVRVGELNAPFQELCAKMTTIEQRLGISYIALFSLFPSSHC